MEGLDIKSINDVTPEFLREAWENLSGQSDEASFSIKRVCGWFTELGSAVLFNKPGGTNRYVGKVYFPQNVLTLLEDNDLAAVQWNITGDNLKGTELFLKFNHLVCQTNTEYFLFTGYLITVNQ